MDKPVSLIINEFKNSIQNAVVNSNLNPVVLEIIMKEIYTDIKNIALQYEQQEMQQYNEKLKEEETNAGVEENRNAE